MGNEKIRTFVKQIVDNIGYFKKCGRDHKDYFFAIETKTPIKLTLPVKRTEVFKDCFDKLHLNETTDDEKCETWFVVFAYMKDGYFFSTIEIKSVKGQVHVSTSLTTEEEAYLKEKFMNYKFSYPEYRDENGNIK